MPARHRFAPLVLAALGCPARPVGQDDGTTAITTTTGASTSAAAPTSGPATTADPATTTGTTGGTTSTGTTSDPLPDATTLPPDGGPSTCGPPCAETWTHVGNLEIGPGPNSTDPDDLACMTQIIGDIHVFDIHGDQLDGLRNLIRAEGFMSIGGDAITSLSPFGCLQEVTNHLQVGPAANLVDLSGLSGLRTVPTFTLMATAATAMPAFSPEFFGISQLQILYNDALVDLDNVAGWTTREDGLWAILEENDALASIAGLQQPFAGSLSPPSIYLIDLPVLVSLAGLEGRADYNLLKLDSLPAIPDLTPLTTMTTVERLEMNSMPQILDLDGLAQLKTAGTLVLGDCWGNVGIGMDGLKDLSGLDSLTTVDALGIAWNSQLTALTGAPMLTTITTRWRVENNSLLGQPAIAAFSAQVGQEPCDEFEDPDCPCNPPPEDDSATE